MMNWEMVTGLIGGVGMFILGMNLMTDGLKIAAGKALKNILEHSTQTPLRALSSGFFITSLVQSSGAVTVATVGFVNAGLLKLQQAVWLVYGSNVGTTMTGWLVALLGFHINIQLMALPLIGIGMFFRMLSNYERHAAYGLALTGFGVLFLGIDILKSTFGIVENAIDLQLFVGEGFLYLLLFLGLGFVMTVLMQSSSAAMALTLTAAGSGLIPLEFAAAMIIGSNLGTTSTAVIAAIGATSNARRVVAAHVIFNVITGAVALLILPLLLWVVSGMADMFEGTVYVATSLALFHTIFNILGVFLMWPLTGFMVAALDKRFIAAEEDEAKARYLDLTLVSTPDLAHHALVKEIIRVAELVSIMAKDAISSESSQSLRLQRDHHIVLRLVESIVAFITRLRQEVMPEYLSPSFTVALASARYFVDVANLSQEIDLAQSGESPKLTPELQEAVSVFRKTAVSAFDFNYADIGNLESDRVMKLTADMESQYDMLKMQLLRQGTQGQVSVRQVVTTLELLRNTRRIAKQMLKGLMALREFNNFPEIETAKEKSEAVSVETIEAGIESAVLSNNHEEVSEDKTIV